MIFDQLSIDTNSRDESDSLGNLKIYASALYGIHTSRAIKNFPLGSERTIGDFPLLVKALLRIKAAAALANYESKLVSKVNCQAIREAVDYLINNYDSSHFPVHHLHGGGGTSANMNVNEVIANQAEEILGGHRGHYRLISPLEDVNLNQSTNDVYPTACHLALIWEWDTLQVEMIKLKDAFADLAQRGINQKRMAKTCLQDALTISYKDLFDGYHAVIPRAIERIKNAVSEIFFINLGGTMIGRREDVPGKYFDRVVQILREDTGLEQLVRQKNLYDAAQNIDDIIHLSTQLALFSRSLIKICKDLRLLASGPKFGFREISILPVQDGSSFKSGKFNPVVPEFVIQCCFAVLGNDNACSAAVDHSELDLSVWESIAVFKTLNSMELLVSALTALHSMVPNRISPTPLL